MSANYTDASSTVGYIILIGVALYLIWHLMKPTQMYITTVDNSPLATILKTSKDDVGYDIHCIADVVFKSKQQTEFVLPIAVQFYPSTCWWSVILRSSAYKKGLRLGTLPVMDPGYQGYGTVYIYNTTDQDITYPIGTSLVQLVVYPFVKPSVQQSLFFKSTTTRGVKGFGSTGHT